MNDLQNVLNCTDKRKARKENKRIKYLLELHNLNVFDLEVK